MNAGALIDTSEAPLVSIDQFEKDVTASLARIETKLDTHKDTLDDHEGRLRTVEGKGNVGAIIISGAGGAGGLAALEGLWKYIHRLF